MTKAEKAFKKWLESGQADLRKRGVTSLEEGIKTLFCDGYDIGRTEEFQDWLETAHWCDEQFKKLKEENLENLAEIAKKS